MAVSNYHAIQGRFIGETTGTTRRDYMTDAVGSVVGTVTSASVQNTYRYKPYGQLLASSGSGTDPRFLWIGSFGYRCTAATGSAYVRYRHYEVRAGSWSTIDVLWPSQSAFVYCTGNPVVCVDIDGLTADCKGKEPENTKRRKCHTWQWSVLIYCQFKSDLPSEGRLGIKKSFNKAYHDNPPGCADYINLTRICMYFERQLMELREDRRGVLQYWVTGNVEIRTDCKNIRAPRNEHALDDLKASAKDWYNRKVAEKGGEKPLYCRGEHKYIWKYCAGDRKKKPPVGGGVS